MLSSRLYNLLSKFVTTDYCKKQPTIENITETIEVPQECCYCAGYFFNLKHECTHLKKAIVSKDHYCNYNECGKSFKNASDLRKHQRIHYNIRKFKCSECLKDFVHQTSLKNHLLTHSKVKSFVCSFCGIAFSTKGNLIQHKIQHDRTIEKKFICKFCDKKFSRSSNLKEHIATHTKNLV